MASPFDQPVPSDLPGATRIVNTAEIACPPARLFEFVTNASQWYRWHPATHAVRDVPERALVLGETMVEHIKAAHRSFEATWTVTACEKPALWRIATATELGASIVTYRLLSHAPRWHALRAHLRLPLRGPVALAGRQPDSLDAGEAGGAGAGQSQVTGLVAAGVNAAGSVTTSAPGIYKLRAI